MRKKLGALVDGTPLPEAEAHALWDRFSAWMEEHRGDLGGFAALEGFASIQPGVDGDRPVLRVSRSAAQNPYAPVRGEEDHSGRGVGHRGGRGPGGSPARQAGPSTPDRKTVQPRDVTNKSRK